MLDGVSGWSVEVRMEISTNVIDKLLESFQKLEECISVTQTVLREKPGIPKEVVCRIEQYSEIVDKQRSLATALRTHLTNRDWKEVSRHVRLINALSSMIRDDAKEILSGAVIGQGRTKGESLT